MRRALASLVDRPTAPRLSGGYAALQSLIDGAVDEDDVNEVKRLCALGVRGSALALRCHAGARRAPAADAAGAARAALADASRVDDAALAEAAERDGAADGDSGGGVAPASVLTAELRRYREIASELERAERLARDHHHEVRG